MFRIVRTILYLINYKCCTSRENTFIKCRSDWKRKLLVKQSQKDSLLMFSCYLDIIKKNPYENNPCLIFQSSVGMFDRISQFFHSDL
jgi:hypothetical protein